MAKNRAFRQQQQSINELDRSLRADLGGDMQFSQNQLGAIFGNLAASGRGMKRQLTKAQTRELAAIGRIAKAGAVGNQRAIRQTERGLGNSFGGEFGTAIQQALGPMQAAATANKTVTRAIGASGVLLAAGGQGALAVQREAANEARAGADYQLASAYAERSKADATEVARAQLALDQMKLQAQLEWQNTRKEMLLVKRLEEEDAKTGGKQQLAGMSLVAESMANASPKLRSLIASGDYKNADEVMAEYEREYGTVSDANERSMLLSLAKMLTNRGLYGSNGKGGGTYDAEIDAVMDAMLTGFGNFSGNKKQIQKAVEASIRAAYTQRSADAMEAGLSNEDEDNRALLATHIQWGRDQKGWSRAEMRAKLIEQGFPADKVDEQLRLWF